MILIYKDSAPMNFKMWNFPGNEVGIQLEGITPDADYFIHCLMPTSDEVLALLNITDALRRAAVPRSRITMYMPYLPYARQDRVCNPGESFALHVFIEVLSQAYFNLLLVDDLHSKVSEDMLIGADIDYLSREQHECAENLPSFDMLVAPDQGAEHKVTKHLQVQSGRAQVLTLTKARSDGKVLYDNLPVGTVSGKVCVVDDICDGGATFLSLADMLLGTQPEITELNLYVTHGIFSKGLSELKKRYANIYVANLYNGDYLDGVVLLDN